MQRTKLGIVALVIGAVATLGMAPASAAPARTTRHVLRGFGVGAGSIQCLDPQCSTETVIDPNHSVGYDSHLGWVTNVDQPDGTTLTTALDGRGTYSATGPLVDSKVPCPAGYDDESLRSHFTIGSGTGRYANASGHYLVHVCVHLLPTSDPSLVSYTFVVWFMGTIRY